MRSEAVAVPPASCLLPRGASDLREILTLRQLLCLLAKSAGSDLRSGHTRMKPHEAPRRTVQVPMSLILE